MSSNFRKHDGLVPFKKPSIASGSTAARGVFGAMAFLLVLSITFGAGGCTSDKQVIAQAAEVHTSLEKAVITDPVLANYLQEVGDRVIEQAAKLSAQGKAPKKHLADDTSWMFDGRMKFHFVNSKTLNAFTTGGEHMYIYTALFQQCRSEDELAGVVAHEFAHVYGRHVHKGRDRPIPLLAGGALLGAAAGYAVAGEDNRTTGLAAGAAVGMVGGQFFNLGFTRDDEYEADKYGFRFYVRAGWDPDRFADFFKQMIEKGYDTTPEIVSSHPSLKNRVERARKMAEDLDPEDRARWRRAPVAGPARFKELQERSVRVGKDMPSDTTLAGAQELLQALPRSCVTPIEQFDDQRQAQERLAERARRQQ